MCVLVELYNTRIDTGSSPCLQLKLLDNLRKGSGSTFCHGGDAGVLELHSSLLLRTRLETTHKEQHAVTVEEQHKEQRVAA